MTTGLGPYFRTPGRTTVFFRLQGVKTVETRNWPMLKDVSGASDAKRCTVKAAAMIAMAMAKVRVCCILGTRPWTRVFGPEMAGVKWIQDEPQI